MLFFHRHPSFFSYILFYYIQGFIQRPGHISKDVFIEECRFFSIPINNQEDEDNSFILNDDEKPIKETKLIKIFSIISLLTTVLSSVILFFNNNSKINYIWIDMTCTIWFMIEFYIRIFHMSNSRDLNRNFQIFIDIISISPVMLSFIVNILSRWLPYLTLLYPFLICLKSFRVLRFIRYNSNLNLIIQTLVSSLNDLSISFILSCLFIIPFGIYIYLIERTEPNSTITDPDHGLSWAIETLTTIGFGEYIPYTFQGRILSIFVCVFGLIILSIPIPIIFENFQTIYENSLKKNLLISSRF